MENLKTLIYKMADSQMILGHRNSEWAGIAPILEEDIAFASNTSGTSPRITLIAEEDLNRLIEIGREVTSQAAKLIDVAEKEERQRVQKTSKTELMFSFLKLWVNYITRLCHLFRYLQ